MHFSVSGGGARGLVFSAFFERLEETELGKRQLERVQSMSGVSAGALVSTALCMGVECKTIRMHTENAGFSKWTYIPRAIATWVGWRTGMYDGSSLYDKMMTACRGKSLRCPLAIGVTTSTMDQKCLMWKPGSACTSVVNCAVASAAVPGLFEPRMVKPVGMVYDGGVRKSTFPVDIAIQHIRSGKPVTLFYSGPWPGYRIDQGTQNRKLISGLLDMISIHGLEWIPETMGEGFNYQDGVFRYKNVTFVAPTGAQYASTGGTAAAGKLFYKPNSDFTRQLIGEGRAIADDYLHKLKTGVI